MKLEKPTFFIFAMFSKFSNQQSLQNSFKTLDFYRKNLPYIFYI